MKLNTDRAFKVNSGMTSAAGIIRDEDGNWISKSALNIRPCSSILAELWELYQGLTLYWDKGFNRIILEVDSQSMVDIIQRKEERINASYRLVKDIHNLLERN